MDVLNLEQTLKQHLNLPDLSLELGKNTQIIIDADNVINIEPTEGGDQIHFYTNYGVLDHLESSDLHEKLLCANYFVFETLGATFSINPADQQIFLTKTLSLAELTETRLTTEFESFFKTSLYWKEELNRPLEKMLNHSNSLETQEALHV